MYPAEKFDTNLQTWLDAIDSGKHTADSLIAMIETRGVLTDVGVGLRLGNSRSALGNVLHIDFLRVSADSEITVEVPIVLEGEAKAVLNEGGIVDPSVDTLTAPDGTEVTLNAPVGEVLPANGYDAGSDSYTVNPDANYNGSDTLNVTVSDGGNTGSGGTLSGSASVANTPKRPLWSRAMPAA